MEFKTLGVFLMFISTSLFANNLEKVLDGNGGYSYAGIAYGNLEYSESGVSTEGSFNSKAKINTPIYMTGSLTKINNKYSFSIDAISTLASSSTNENWDLNNQFIQSNQFDSSLSEFKILGHYTFAKGHNILAGSKYTYFTAKRYQFKDTTGTSIAEIDDGKIVGGLSEESISTLYISLGYEYESASFASRDLRYKIGTLISKPIWRRAENTAFEKVTFDSLSGYAYEINTYIGYKIIDNLEIGLFGEYSVSKKNGSSHTLDSSGNQVQWPSNELKVLRAGLKCLWKF